MAIEDFEIPRKTMVLFFVVDTSSSMEGEKIGALNTAIEEIIPDIADISDENPDTQIKIAVLEFSNGARWITPPIESNQFHWNDLQACGRTDFGAACKELNEKLSTKAFMKNADGTGFRQPAIFLLSDGEPTDKNDWPRELNALKQNKWFDVALKVALAIGNSANTNVLAEFTGNKETVVEAHNAKVLKKMIQVVSVSITEVGSKPADTGATNGNKLGEVISEAKEQIAASPDNDQRDW